jgi:hypothetical protein
MGAIAAARAVLRAITWMRTGGESSRARQRTSNMVLCRVRKTLALLLLGAFTVRLGVEFHELLRVGWFSDGRAYPLLPLPAANLLALYGIARQRAWGRGIALSWALGGFVFIFTSSALFVADWGGLLLMAHFGLLAACLLGPTMAACCEGHAGARLPQQGGRSTLVRWGAILVLAAVPALWIYCLEEGRRFSSGLRLGAIGTAATIVIGGILLWRGRTAGALLMMLAGAASLCLAGFLLSSAPLPCNFTDPSEGMLLKERVLFSLNWGLAAAGAVSCSSPTSGHSALSVAHVDGS